MGSKEYNQKYYKENREKLKKDAHDYYHEHKEEISIRKKGSVKVQEYKTRYWHENKEKIRDRRRKSRDKDRQANKRIRSRTG